MEVNMDVRARLAGVWSATPTPFTDDMEVDVESVQRSVEHHLRLGMKGLFLCGTCGEGPWMPDRLRRDMIKATAESAQGRLAIAAQVTDNSAARIIDNMEMACEAGAEIAIIAPPFFLLNATPERLTAFYREAIDHCPLPVGIYDRGLGGAVVVENESLADIYADERVAMVKDSSTDGSRRDIALAERERRPELLLLTGYEFGCVEYLAAGYDGLLLGGGIFNGFLAGQMMEAMAQGDRPRAEEIQARMNEMMYEVYGGKEITCWLSGQKRLLVEMGVFSTWKSFLNYPLTPECEADIVRMVEEDDGVLFP